MYIYIYIYIGQKGRITSILQYYNFKWEYSTNGR